jgi:exosortase/archaeosortase family protein
MTADLLAPAAHPARHLRASARRRLVVAVELAVAVLICLAGYFWAAATFREREASLAVAVLHLVGVPNVSDVLPGHILMFRGPGDVLDGVVTTSCSSLLTVMGLIALNVAVMRSRRGHAVLGLVAATVAVVVANSARLVLSALAGLWWGGPAMTLFHDWIGTLWALATTLLGFLVMVCVALPAAERAEQDAGGRHTARRPSSWARPGLGYRAMESADPVRSGRSLAGLLHRYVLPARVSRRLAARRESRRIDYRIGHQPPAVRIDTIRQLVADGLGAHTASLLAVATYDEDVEVIDALAEAVAARQWEPVTNDRVAALRLWARGWLLARRTPRPGPADLRDADVVLLTGAQPPVPVPAEVPRHRPLPRTFARPTRDGDPTPEDYR